MQKEKYFGLSHRIARWKLDSFFENWLSYKSDTSSFFKSIYVFYYKIFDTEYYKTGIRMARKAIVNHSSGKGLSNVGPVVKDMVYCLHRFGISFQDYCIYDFVNHYDILYRNSFVSDKLRYYYCDMLNSPEISAIMTDKFACYQRYKKFYKREMIGCFTESNKQQFLSFVTKHPVFIYKPLDDHSGHGINVFTTSGVDPVEFFVSNLQNGPFVLEELIEQGDELAKMHPQSVNSLRVVTFTMDRNVKILGATWRIGSGESVKDNAGSGGMYAFVNPKTGIVETDAINYLGVHFKQHPDTNFTFEGFKMPSWEEAISMVDEMATYLSGSTLIAWDIAYSKRGWVMVEANESGDWSIIQSNKKNGMKSLLFMLMDEYFQTNASYC